MKISKEIINKYKSIGFSFLYAIGEFAWGDNNPEKYSKVVYYNSDLDKFIEDGNI